jgi:hypothetical protein
LKSTSAQNATRERQIDLSKFFELLCPAEYAPELHLVDLDKLRERGIRVVLLDLDNTLVPWHGFEIKPETISWVRSLKEHGIRACIVSNTRYPSRLRKIAAELGVPSTTKGMKPRRAGFREALKMLDASIAEAAVIGDQIFTDILGGNRLGLYTILVYPIQKKEFIGTKVSRFFEKFVLRRLRERGVLDFSGPSSQSPAEQTADTSRQK